MAITTAAGGALRAARARSNAENQVSPLASLRGEAGIGARRLLADDHPLLRRRRRSESRARARARRPITAAAPMRLVNQLESGTSSMVLMFCGAGVRRLVAGRDEQVGTRARRSGRCPTAWRRRRPAALRLARNRVVAVEARRLRRTGREQRRRAGRTDATRRRRAPSRRGDAGAAWSSAVAALRRRRTRANTSVKPFVALREIDAQRRRERAMKPEPDARSRSSSRRDPGRVACAATLPAS